MGVVPAGLARNLRFRARRNEAIQTFEVVRCANQRKFTLDFLKPAQQKRSESHCAFDDTKGRFNGALTLGVKLTAIGGL